MKEVQRVLKPSESEQPKLINRRSGKARKGSFVPKSSQPQSQTFQKKVVVLKYMGSKPPLQFNINDGLILTTGFLPEISYESTELEVRQIIIEVLHNDTAEDLTSVTTYDFLFVAVKGKKATILTCLPRNFEYSGRILKQTAGNGPVYIRLTASLSKQPRVTWSPLSSDSDFELPDASSIYNKKPKSSKMIIEVSDADSDFELPSTTTGTSMPALSTLLSSTSQGHRCTALHHSTTKEPANASQSASSASVKNTSIPVSSVSLGGRCCTSTPQPTSLSTSSDNVSSAMPVSTDTSSTSGARLYAYGSLSLSSHSTCTSNQHHVDISQSTSSVSASNTLPVSTYTPLTLGRRRTYRSLSLRRPTSAQQPVDTFQYTSSASNTLSAMSVSTDTPSTSGGHSNESTQHLPSLVEHSPRSVVSTNHAPPSPLSTSHAPSSPLSLPPTSLPVTSSRSIQISCGSNESPFNFDQELEFLQYSPVKDVSPSLERLCEMFPNFKPDAIKILYEIYNEDGALVSDCLVEGVQLHCLLQQLNLRFISVSIPETPKIRIEGDDDWVDAAFTFYKGQSFCKDAPVRLVMTDEPAIDAGGVSAQFFAEVYKRLAEGKKKIFEGELDFVRPVFNLSLVGVLKVFGIIVAHSIIVQRVGFPYFSPSCYYFMLGHYEIAATKVLRKEASGKIESYEGNVYEELECFESLVELMDECGIIDIPIKRYNMARITQAILLFDTLQKRKLLLDMIGEGLDMHYGLRRLMSHFPTIFEPLFLYSGTLTSRDIINIIIPPECTSERNTIYWIVFIVF
ncbi:PREDICTED: uncharacterized protein LOC109588875 isoform X2 [Amphimedon queenslandica]|uniref:HECT domain-containing protein n=1 Tax=Amphimedon queenslandica TaxID=400682 RepID=A0A1X7TAR7_AMPQE|nr:PREDICTED: uncharacterized protein LOC109588875 isoform X2 [Amphimedon queenslandica]|eukprot:XP_019860541.1 PREDICTED: uncharacterized protein LOC109588875 isoform X2 [Amphimedon queenslandica]